MFIIRKSILRIVCNCSQMMVRLNDCSGIGCGKMNHILPEFEATRRKSARHTDWRDLRRGIRSQFQFTQNCRFTEMIAFFDLHRCSLISIAVVNRCQIAIDFEFYGHSKLVKSCLMVSHVSGDQFTAGCQSFKISVRKATTFYQGCKIHLAIF